MSFQRCLTLASPKGGTMAATSSRYRNWTSRQRLRRGCQLVSPGGKMLDGVEQAFQQQGHQQLPVQPGSATILPLFRQIPQSKDRFHPLEIPFNLPAATIPGQHGRRVQHRRQHVGPDKEVPRQQQSRPRQLLLLLGGSLPQRPPLPAGRPAVSFDRHQPPRVVTPTMADDSRPLPNLSDSRRTQFRDQPERFSLDVEQWQRLVVDSHQDVPAGLGDVGDPRRGAVASVPQQQITRSHRDSLEGLTPMNIGDFDEVALQILQIDAEVNPPVGAEAAGPADGRGIDGADATTVGQRRGGVTLPKLVGHPAQPLLSRSKPLEQSHGRDVTPTGLLDAGDRLLEGTAAGQVNQQGSQQDGGIGKTASAPQCTQDESLLLPARRQELTHQWPVIQLLYTCIGIHLEKNTDLRPRQPSLKLTPMGVHPPYSSRTVSSLHFRPREDPRREVIRMEPQEPNPISSSAPAGTATGGSASSTNTGGTPVRGRAGAVHVWVLGAGVVATFLSWLLIEATLGTFKPKGTANRFMGSTFLIPGAQERASTETRNAVLAFGLMGAAVGLVLGATGSLARRLHSCRAAAVLGLVLGAAAGAGAALVAVPAASRVHERNPGNMSLEMASSLIAHGGPWGAVGAVGGLAFGLGFGGRGRAVRGLLGGLVGAVAVAILFEVVGALALPDTKTMEPVAATWGIRLLAQSLAVITTAVGIAALVADSADRRC